MTLLDEDKNVATEQKQHSTEQVGFLLNYTMLNASFFNVYNVLGVFHTDS